MCGGRGGRLEKRALSSLQHLPFFHGPPGVPRSPIKRSSLTSPAQVPCPTGQFHFCPQPGFQAPSPPVTCTPGTPFLPEADDHLLEIRLFWVLLAQRCPTALSSTLEPRQALCAGTLQDTCWTQITNSQEHSLLQSRGQDPAGP